MPPKRGKGIPKHLLEGRQRRIRKDGHLVYTKELKYDHGPLWAAEFGPPDHNGHRHLIQWMAFDPRYGPETQEQIDYFTDRGVDTSEWKVGERCKAKVTLV